MKHIYPEPPPNKRLIDLREKRFGRLLVVGFSHHDGHRYRWVCRCDCGTVKVVSSDKLRRGATVSCGCARADRIGNASRTHGMSGTRVYTIWRGMLARCYDPKSTPWYLYGARGIKVCRRWRTSFANFLADMGEPTPDLSLDRKDGKGNYEPSNCRWATRKQQGENRCDVRPITFRGRTMLAGEWEKETGIGQKTIQFRLKRGWSVEEALTVAPSLGSNRYKYGLARPQSSKCSY